MAAELTFEELRQIYIDDLTKMVAFDFKLRPRVRYPEKWKQIPTPQNTLLLENDIINRTWVWSDLHFGHVNIIDFSERPFTTVEQMNEHLIANFNDYVGENDVSIWVGDIAFMNDTNANEILDRCNGYKILIIGNHDFKKKKLKKLNFDETHLLYTLNHDGANLVFTHYPIQQGLPKPYINVHGHIHKTPFYKFETPQHINVNCEFHEYKPIPLNKIINWAKMRNIVNK